MNSDSLKLIFLASLLLSFSLSLLIRSFASKKNFGLDTSLRVPRLGGLAILTVGLTVSISLYNYEPKLIISVSCAILVSIAGFLDDVGLSQGALSKLLTSLVAAAICLYSTGVYISNINTPILSIIMDYTPLAIFLSVTALAGMSHGVNLIDGIHGLALSFSTIAFISLSFISVSVNELYYAALSISIAGACLGLMPLNFPSGSIFLGDVGSYFLGFLGAFVAISICYKNPSVSPLAMYCIFVYPVVDVSYSTVRRISKGKNPIIGDRYHLHHRILRLTDSILTTQNVRSVFISTLACSIMALGPALVGALHYDRPDVLIVVAASSTASLLAINFLISLNTSN